MSIELTYLTYTLLLAFVYILAFDVARTGQYGSQWNVGARDAEMPPLSAVAGRLKRAQDNLFETLPLFAGAVIIASLAHKSNSLTQIGAQVYFWCRVAYLPLYGFGVPMVRSLVWVVSIAGMGAIYYAVLT